MTCRDMLRIGHPGLIDDSLGIRGIIGCPSDFGLMKDPDYCLRGKFGHSYDDKRKACEKCWNRELPESETEEKQYTRSCMELFEEYKQLCHVDEKYIAGWSPYGKDTIKVRFTDGKEIIWTLHSSDHWSMETLEHYYQRISAIRNV